MFIHVPIPEFVDVWNNEICYGSKKEDCCCPLVCFFAICLPHDKKVNTGLYDTMAELGDVRMLMVGHDHKDDYCGSFAAHPDLWLCYGRKTGFGSYDPRWPMHHGARVVELLRDSSGNIEFATWVRDDWGEKVTLEEHSPEGSDQLTC